MKEEKYGNKGCDGIDLTVQQWLNTTYPSLSVTEDGITGGATFLALIKALQTELGLEADGDFGNLTLNACPDPISTTEHAQYKNINYTIQGSFYCKGYNPGGFDGEFGDSTASAVKLFQKDAGIAQDGVIHPYILQGIIDLLGNLRRPPAMRAVHSVMRGKKTSFPTAHNGDNLAIGEACGCFRGGLLYDYGQRIISVNKEGIIIEDHIVILWESARAKVILLTSL